MGWKRDRVTGEVIFVPDAPTNRGIVVPASGKAALEVPKIQADIASTGAGIENTNAGTVRTRVQTQGDALANRTAAQSLRNYPISKEDAAVIDRQRQQADVAARALLELRQSAKASDRFNPSPDRALNVNRAIPKEGEWPTTQLARQAYAGIAGIRPQDVEDYIDLDRYRQARVATIQQEQKGPQTESDAMRYMKATFGPDKTPRVNAAAVGEAVFNAKMDELRPGHYAKWANRYGSLSALNERGQSVDQWWNGVRQDGWNRYTSKQKARKSGGGSTANAPRKGWKIERLDD